MGSIGHDRVRAQLIGLTTAFKQDAADLHGLPFWLYKSCQPVALANISRKNLRVLGDLFIQIAAKLLTIFNLLIIVNALRERQTNSLILRKRRWLDGS
jgi:hypothetical protein